MDIDTVNAASSVPIDPPRPAEREPEPLRDPVEEVREREELIASNDPSRGANLDILA